VLLKRTSQNSVKRKFAKSASVSWSAAQYTKAMGEQRGRRNGPAPPPEIPPARLLSALSQEVRAPSMHLSGHSEPRGTEGTHEKARLPRRGEIRAAGPNAILLPARGKDDRPLSPRKDFHEKAHLVEADVAALEIVAWRSNPSPSRFASIRTLRGPLFRRPGAS
jgi:hypothetical protein